MARLSLYVEIYCIYISLFFFFPLAWHCHFFWETASLLFFVIVVEAANYSIFIPTMDASVGLRNVVMYGLGEGNLPPSCLSPVDAV